MILHDAVPDGAAPDLADAVVQAGVFESALSRRGWSVERVGVGLDLGPAARAVERAGLVVNLVESLGGRGAFIHLAAEMVEALGVAMTGCPAWAVGRSSNKLSGKGVLRAWGLATPEWYEPTGPAPRGGPRSGRWIIKSVWEHASIGLGPGSVVDLDGVDMAGVDLGERVAAAAPGLGGRAFAERYVEGREFNLSVLEVGGRAEVLPIAEIEFVDFGPGVPRIVDYAAKWDESSHAYTHTPRRFDFPASDASLLAELGSMARRAWAAFGLRGYARVDFRVDAAGRPWILEINTNPCVSPDAGFMAAAARAGLTEDGVIGHILEAALGGAARDAGAVGDAGARELGGAGGAVAPIREGRGSAGHGLSFRAEVRAGDEAAVGRMVAATGFFRPDEVGVACELVRDRETKGAASDYRFILADDAGGSLVGYVCYGPIACTVGGVDLYWIVVDPAWQGRGLGGELLRRAEAAAKAQGGRGVYIETSSQPRYAPTRRFYERHGYGVMARLADFYEPGDDKLVYGRRLTGGSG